MPGERGHVHGIGKNDSRIHDDTGELWLIMTNKMTSKK